MKSNLLPVAKEGLIYIGYSFLAFIVFAILGFGFFELLAFIATLFFIYAFRNPERELPRFEQNSVISPVDGTVLSIDEISDKEYSYKITINSNYLDVGMLRTPVTGSVSYVEKINGSRLKSDIATAQKINENAIVVFEDSNSNRVKISHMLKQSFNGIKMDIAESQNMLQTSRYGVMINGITTIYLPQNFRLDISVGNELKAAETLVGYFS